MANFSGSTVYAGEKAVIDDNAAANTSAEGHGNKVLHAVTAAGDLLAESGAVGVISHIGLFFDALGDQFTERRIDKAEISGKFYDTALCDSARGSDTDRDDIIHEDTALDKCHEHDLFDGVGNFLCRARDICWNRGLAHDFIGVEIHYAGGNIGTSEINTYTIHFISSLKLRCHCVCQMSSAPLLSSSCSASSYMPRRFSSSFAELCPIFLRRLLSAAVSMMMARFRPGLTGTV